MPEKSMQEHKFQQAVTEQYESGVDLIISSVWVKLSNGWFCVSCAFNAYEQLK